MSKDYPYSISVPEGEIDRLAAELTSRSRPEHKVEVKLTEALEAVVELGNEVNRLRQNADEENARLRASAWIRVEDQLPEDKQDVLVWAGADRSSCARFGRSCWVRSFRWRRFPPQNQVQTLRIGGRCRSRRDEAIAAHDRH